MKNLKSVAILAATSLLLAACGKGDGDAQAGEVLRPVRTVVVETRSAMNAREFSGVVDAERKVDLAFRVNGTLEKLPVLEGEHVGKGQLVAALDQTDFSIQLRAVQADFERARAEYDRSSTLVERKLISRADFERVQAQFLVAKAELARARQDLEYTTLRSPFNGYIARRHVENLSEVSARSPVLTLTDLDSMVVRIGVPESIMIVARREGVRPQMYAVFGGNESRQYPLEIREIGAQPDSGTLTYPLSLSLPPISDLNILPGMSVVVRVRPFSRSGQSAEVAYLPSQAVLEDSGGRFVFVAVPTDPGMALVERRNVGVGEISTFGLQVLSGLKDGERVVTAGMSQLSSGQRVLLPVE